jgi:hypothetical protein
MSASDIMTMSLNMNDENDDDNRVESEDFETTSDDVSENDDEIRSKKKIMRFDFRFFFSLINKKTFEKKKTMRIVF